MTGGSHASCLGSDLSTAVPRPPKGRGLRWCACCFQARSLVPGCHYCPEKGVESGAQLVELAGTSSRLGWQWKLVSRVAIHVPWQVSAALRQAGELFIQTYDRVFPAPQPREPSP